MNFLFWNIRKNDNILVYLQDICNEKEVDVLVLEESPFTDIHTIAKRLSSFSKTYCALTPIFCKKIQIFIATDDIENCYLIHETARFTAWNIPNTLLGEFTLIGLHYQSKLNWSSADQLAHSSKLRNFVLDVEEKIGHQRTVVLGDFNMNPFDKAMVAHTGLNAVMEKSIAQQKTRTVDEDDYDFFYNPMWGFLGDLGKGSVSGTHYYNSSAPINYYWHILDQVLLRPVLIDYLEDIEILTKIFDTNLLTPKNFIDKTISDHLPVFFSLKI
jgi:exonuclease III